MNDLLRQFPQKVLSSSFLLAVFGNGELIELNVDGKAHVIELEQFNL